MPLSLLKTEKLGKKTPEKLALRESKNLWFRSRELDLLCIMQKHYIVVLLRMNGSLFKHCWLEVEVYSTA